jgi:acetyl esterase
VAGLARQDVPKGEGRTRWTQDPEKVQDAIIAAATEVFARDGFSKTRLEDIAAQTETSKRMIYYYFEDKSGLYRRVLEAAYARINAGESQIQLAGLSPKDAFRKLIEFQFDHQRANPEFVRLIMVENIHNAQTLKASDFISSLKPKARGGLETVYESGVATGEFRPGLDPLKLRWMFAGLSVFNVSNRPTFSTIFGDALYQEDEQDNLRAMLVDVMLRYVLAPRALSRHLGLTEKDLPKMINPELEKFLSVWDAKWAVLPAGATAQDRRKHFEVIAAEMRLPTPEDVDCDAEHWVETAGGPVRVRVFRHKDGGDAQPCLIYLHGGAFMQGSPETHWDITARIASWNRQTVVSVDYALTPEHPFPKALDQTVGVARWVHANAAALCIDPTRISIGGDSAGGNIAAAAALDLRGSDVGLLGQLLIYPCCDFDTSRPSYAQNAEGPLLKVSGMKAVNAMYCPDPADLLNPRAAPLLAASHENLPPAYIAVAQNDPLRDSGTAYADALQAAGVPVVLDGGEGLIHGYLRAMEYCSASHEALERMCAWLQDVQRR